jgi:hypothetical protein
MSNEQSVTNKKEKIYGETHNDEVIKKKLEKHLQPLLKEDKSEQNEKKKII